MNKKPSWLAMWNGALLVSAVIAFVFWHATMQELNRQIARKRSGLKSLYIVGRLPPNREVTEYLAGRTAVLKALYDETVSVAGQSSDTLAREGASAADPQLFFQERVHEVQRLLERLAAGRDSPVPAQLGFPKELPPPDAVPRFLTQLSLIESVGQRVMELPGVLQVTSFKVEDPQSLPTADQDEASFITLFPVRVKLTCSLDALAKVIGLLDEERPLIQVRSVRITAPDPEAALDVELVLARAGIDAALPDAAADSDAAPTGKNKKHKT